MCMCSCTIKQSCKNVKNPATAVKTAGHFSLHSKENSNLEEEKTNHEKGVLSVFPVFSTCCISGENWHATFILLLDYISNQIMCNTLL